MSESDKRKIRRLKILHTRHDIEKRKAACELSKSEQSLKKNRDILTQVENLYSEYDTNQKEHPVTALMLRSFRVKCDELHAGMQLQKARVESLMSERQIISTSMHLHTRKLEKIAESMKDLNSSILQKEINKEQSNNISIFQKRKTLDDIL